MALILGIETSCDEAACAVYDSEKGMLSSVLHSQIEAQQLYGGVVPELASRMHLDKIDGIVKLALDTAQVTLDDIDAIAVTNKPGLPGSLLVGLCFAKGMVWAKEKKLIGVNHLEGHAFSALIENKVPFPHLCLTASGGHTSLYEITDFGAYTVLGQTMDDAAGEAFDKIAKLLNIPYPGGPIIEKLAREVDFEDFFKYPRGKKGILDFSFSGLKTAVLYDMVKRGWYDMEKKQLVAADLDTVRKQVSSSLLVCIKDIFLHRLAYALEVKPHIKAVTFVGGVACNKYIREHMLAFCKERGLEFFVPSPKYCTDNGGMIAFVGNYKYQRNQFDDLTLDIW
ncbi:MAG: tRNA (adenosine(37)-N6)-threonylcarbamoyltransferase complex transferase subunit TsaD [Candidatus Babeliales bacterium]